MNYYNYTMEKKWIIIIQILLTYILHVEISFPRLDFIQPLYYSYLICRNKLKLWILCVNLLFIVFYCIIRLFNQLEEGIIWSIVHYAATYTIWVIMNYEINKQDKTRQSSQLIDFFQNSERYRWKEMSQHELFQDYYTKYLCFNQIREGVVLYEQGYDKHPTFINRSAKSMFSVNDETQIQQIFQNYTKVERNDVKRSLQSIRSFGFDVQNSIFKQYSGSFSCASKGQSQFKQTGIKKEITLQQILDKIWNFQKKESYLFYVQHQKQSQFQQYQPILEINVYVNNQVKKVMTLICRDLSYKTYISQLQSQNNQKSKMISFVSHEFRAPLGCMITMLEHVAKDQNNSYIQTSIENSKYLLNLCNDLLDLAQIQANKFQARVEKFNLVKLCQECFQMYSLQAEKKQLKLILVYSNDCPSTIISDKSRIKQIVINLIGNAFKFTQEGQIQIQVELTQPDKLEIFVSDTGIGIQDQDKEILMKAFGKINSEESKKLNAQGVGLGLVISNKIAQQIGDGLKFESTYHKGSKFSFTVNLKDNECYSSELVKTLCHKQSMLKDCGLSENLDEDDDESSKEIKIVVTQPKKSIIHQVECCSKILIVDDTQFNIETLQMLLNKIGFSQVDYSINGYKAIEKVKQKQKCTQCQSVMYGLIFMDLEMLGINGISASQFIFEFCEESNIQSPIIVACSGYQKEVEFPKCLQVGMKFYLEKPVSLKQLRPIIDYYRQSL